MVPGSVKENCGSKRRKIDWKRGSTTVMIYMMIMWLTVLAALMFVEYFDSFAAAGKTQIYADLSADGSAFNGNNGWGLDQDKALDTKTTLDNYNSEYFDGPSVEMSFVKTDAASREEDTVHTSATVYHDSRVMGSLINAGSTSPLMGYDGTTGEATAVKEASTQITYSGGMRIVMEAWRHTYQFLHGTAGQTRYVFGAGHGSDLEWEQFADCSGFVSGVYRKCGYDVPNWACTWNLEQMGDQVGDDYSDLENARPGDIILYWWDSPSGGSDHVGIYAGKHNGTHYQVHCSGGTANSYLSPGSGSTKGAVLAPVNSGARKITIRRIVNTDAEAYDTPRATIPGLTEYQTTIYHVLDSTGQYSKAAIAGIMGNWQQESGCCPTLREGHISEYDSFNTSYAQQLKNGSIAKYTFVMEGIDRFDDRSEGYGLAQWTTTDLSNPMADRKAKLWDYTNGKVYDLMMQVSFAAYEIPTVWNQICAEDAPSSYQAASFNSFARCTDPADATLMFLTHYEGVWDGSPYQRVNKANHIYDIIKYL